MRDPIDIEIPAELWAKMDALPDVRWGGHRPFTHEEDAALLAYWPVKVKLQVAKMLGRAESVCRKRYDELTEGIDAGPGS
jgi:hypothetical protein